MKNKILKWLTESVKMKLQTDIFENELRDGVLLFKLLNHYGVVNEKVFKHITPSDNPKVCENNLRELAVWFRLLDIKFDETIISDIVKGRTKTCIKLLNGLYEALHDKRRLQFVELGRHKTKVTSGRECLCCSWDHITDIIYHEDNEEFLEEELDESAVDDVVLDETVFDEAVLDESMLDESVTEKEPLCKFSTRNEEKSPYKKGTLYDRIRNEDIQFVRNELKKSYRKLARKKRRTVDENTEDEEEEEMGTEGTMFATDSAGNTTKTVKHSITIENVASQENTERDQLKTIMLENILQKSEYEKQLALETLKTAYQGKIDKKRLAGMQKLLNEEPKGYANFFSSCKTSEEEIACQLEAIDKFELHRKLYDEKIRKRNKARLLRCKQIVQDLVVLAMKISEYGKESVTNNLKMQWKQSLILGEAILQDPDETDAREMSVINLDEKFSGTVNDFDNYNHLICDWFSQSGPDVSFDDLFILAHIVNRLQESRFPPVIRLKPADLPRYRITSVLNGTLDELTIIKLKCLLAKSKICIVDTSSAIEFCVSQYKLEANIKPPEPPSKKVKKEKPKAATAATNKSKSGKKTAEPIVTRQDKEAQTTPSVFEDIDKPKELSCIAQLGMKFYNIEAPKTTADIPTKYRVDALVQFLKFQKNIDGWVLVNFPLTLEEAFYLEKAFSGKTFPEVFNVSENREDELEEEPEEEEEIPFDRTTHSRLVHLPAKKPDVFSTYFTSFINVIKEETVNDLVNNANTVRNSEEPNMKQEEDASEDEEEENILDLTTIYRNQGVLQEFFYGTLNFNALKELARVILQCDSDVAKVPSIEVFGEEVIKFYEKAPTAETPKQTPKKTANKKTPKGKDELTATKEFLEQLMTVGQTQPAPAELDSQVGEETQIITEEIEPETFLFPGQEGWSFAQFPMFKEDELALSNLWEEIEADYITRIEHVLRVNRKNEELTAPYLNFLEKTMNDVHDPENRREKIVTNFVQYFNSALEHRHDSDTFEKISNGLFNMERRLWEISEESRNDLELKRRHAIDQNWTTDRMIEIGKNYISLMEVEFNRCNSTLNFLYKYYSFMCGVQSSNQVPNVQPNCFARDWDECEIRSTVAKKLEDRKEINALNPVCSILENANRHYLSEIKILKSDNDYFVDTYQDFVITHKNEYQAWKKEEDTKNIMQFKKPKTASKEESDEGIPAVLQAEDTDLVNMFLEWRAAVKSELDRATWRIKMIKEKSFETLNNLETLVIDIFYEYYDKNIASYYKENECIDNLCKLFNSAMDAGLPITGNVIAEGKCIYIYKEIPHGSDFKRTIEEEMSSICFTVDQLYVIAKHLKSASTNGIIRKLAMRLLIEDMIFVEQSPEHIPLFPKNWNNLCSAELKRLLQDAFGASSKMHWKDFILYCLDLSFPDIEDIVEHKNQFLLYDKEHKGTVSYNDYSRIKFWFQLARDYTVRKDYYKSVKEFLFYLFKINDDEFDYIDFLLSFSKGETPASGFGKALASLSGKCIIISNKLAHLELILTEYNEMLNKMVKEILVEIMTTAVDEVSGVKIEELVEEEIEEQFGSEFETIRSAETEPEDEDATSNVDKQSQTVSLTEIMYDEYITKNKVLQWTGKIPVELIHSLLENRVYRTLEFQDDVIHADDIKRNIKESISRLEVDGIIDVPSLLEDLPFYSLFLYTHSFQIFSFSSAVESGPKCFKQF